MLADYLNETGVELGQHLNGDEAMTFGAAFYAANMSHNFKTKPLWFYDGYNFSMKIRITSLDEKNKALEVLKEMFIFKEKFRFNGKKLITFKSDHNI